MAGPRFQLATLVAEPPEGPEWIHEIKLDGYRLLGRIERGRVRLETRNGLDWTDRFPGVAGALAKLPVRSALVDGEAVVFDAHGKSRFSALQAALGRAGIGVDVHFALFDCLALEGRDLRRKPLLERKEALRKLVSRAKSPLLHYSDHVIGDGAAFFAAACRSGVEGIVSKRADAPYRAARTRAWLKVKCSKRQEFVIVGFTEPSGSRVGLGALLLAVNDADGALRFAGKVGTGFDGKTLAALRAKLARLERARAPVADPPRSAGLHWVAPRLVAEISFTEWTRDGKARHPVFLGLREDKAPADVRVESPDLAVESPAPPGKGRRRRRSAAPS
ncbi:MAG TPA: non-homologous end-joining DNA ligase [Myxococcota bacterium]|nr:non-homologous end-joining DNA ligase [Myxococcota bacterium]